MTDSDRLLVGGRRADNGDWSSVLVVHEEDGSWTVQGPDGPGVRLTAQNMHSLAAVILGRAR